jgi:GNAT superfamily N-acetyltransferase
LWAADPRASGPPPHSPLVEVREVSAGSAQVIVEVMGAEGDLVAMRLARGCRCFGAWIGPEVVGYGWLSARDEWIGELQLGITPDRGEAYIWNCVTVPRHRRKGIFSAVVASIVAQARTEGFARVWIGSVANSAERAVVRAGFVPVLNFNTVSVWGLLWLAVRPADGADPGLVAALRRAMAVGGRPLQLGATLRRSRRRRH